MTDRTVNRNLMTLRYRYSHLFDSALRNGVQTMDEVMEKVVAGEEIKEVFL